VDSEGLGQRLTAGRSGDAIGFLNQWRNQWHTRRRLRAVVPGEGTEKRAFAKDLNDIQAKTALASHHSLLPRKCPALGLAQPAKSHLVAQFQEGPR
jgi:hypothetical protein